jgi:hypothetical protein
LIRVFDERLGNVLYQLLQVHYASNESKVKTEWATSQTVRLLSCATFTDLAGERIGRNYPSVGVAGAAGAAGAAEASA